MWFIAAIVSKNISRGWVKLQRQSKWHLHVYDSMSSISCSPRHRCLQCLLLSLSLSLSLTLYSESRQSIIETCLVTCLQKRERNRSKKWNSCRLGHLLADSCKQTHSLTWYSVSLQVYRCDGEKEEVILKLFWKHFLCPLDSPRKHDSHSPIWRPLDIITLLLSLSLCMYIRCRNLLQFAHPRQV